MKETLRNLFISFLLLIPVFLVNFAYHEISLISRRWDQSDQERLASQKLNEIAAHVDIQQQISSAGAKFKGMALSLLNERENILEADSLIKKMTQSVFAKPFPLHDIWVFSKKAGETKSSLKFTNDERSPRRPMEMLASFVSGEESSEIHGNIEYRRNEKLLQKIFGNGCTARLVSVEQKGVATPVIYRSIPSFLIWDEAINDAGDRVIYFFIVPRNQDLTGAAYSLAAGKTGMGKEFAGGFLSIYQTSKIDYLFPEKIAASKTFKKWRAKLGTTETRLDYWQEKGLPWGEEIGNQRIYSRILPLHKHLAFIIFPDLAKFIKPWWLKLINFFSAAIITLIVIRGILLGQWPFARISYRFAIVFILAVSLPVSLFLTSATAYIQDRFKADENSLEQRLSTSLLDFDAGKELLETDYISVFNGMVKDKEILNNLKTNGLDSSEAVFKRVLDIAESNETKLPLSGVALYDLAGNLKYHARGGLHPEDFSTMARFYGLPFTTNLRKTVSQEEPDFKLPEQKIDERNIAAMQSFQRSSGGIESEVERFRFRVIRTDVGRGHVSYIYDFIMIDGRARYVLMMAWLDIDVDRIVLGKAAAQLGLKIPELKFVGFKRTPAGLKEILPPSRSVSSADLKTFYRVAESAASIRSGMLKTVSDEMSIVAYASKHFNRTVLVAGIDHSLKQRAHFYRKLLFILLGIFSFIVLVLSAIVTFERIIVPIQKLKEAFDQIESGLFPKIPVSMRSDEIGLLSKEFAKMVRGLEERQRLATLLSDQAVEAVVTSSGGQIDTKSFHGILLVSDIRSFTTMCEKYEPQIITNLLNRHFAEMAEVITSHGGRIYKFIGDAIEAVFVDENHSECAAERAVRAGAMMLQKLEKINQERLQLGLFSYQMGAGITSGHFVSGETGSKDSRLDYAILGPAFKKGEMLEAATKCFQDFPLLISREVAEAISISDWKLSKEEISGEEVYRFLEKPGIFNDSCSAGPVKSQENVSEFSSSALDPKKIDSWVISTESRKKYVFLAGMIVLLFPAFAIIGSAWTGLTAKEKRQRKIAENWCSNALDKVTVSESQSIVYEEYIDSLSEKIGAKFNWNPSGVTASELADASQEVFKQLLDDGFEPSLFAVLHKPGGNDSRVFDDTWKLVSYHGPEEQREITQELLRYFALKFYTGWPKVNHLLDSFKMLLGTGMPFMHLYNDMHARVSLIKRRGQEELYFWQPIYIRNTKAYKDAMLEFSSRKLRDRPGPDALLQVGTFLCIVPKQVVVKNHLQTLVKVLSREPVEFAFKGKSELTILSGGFPLSADKLDRSKEELEMPEWHFESALPDGVENGTRVWICRKIHIPGKKLFSFAVFFVGLVMFFLIRHWHQAVYSEIGISEKFAWQLWAGLFIAAVIPLSVVYSLNERFASDQLEKISNQEQANLIEKFEELERRQFLQEVVEWDKLDKMSFDEEMQLAVNSVNRNPENGRPILTDTVRSLASDKSRYGLSKFTEMLIFHSSGWQHSVTAENLTKESGEFQRFINAFVDLLFNDLGVQTARKSENAKLGSAVKDEMTREAGLEIFRTVFGSDSYFRLVHGIGLPVNVFMATGIGCFKLIPYPDLVKPEAIFYWLFFDSLNSSMRKIFRVSECDYPVFTESKVMYGALKQPWTGGWGYEAVKFARWALAKKTPLSARVDLAGRECLVEARIGNHNEAMIMIGLIPEAGIFQKIESARQKNLFLLILSILAIIMLSLLVAGDLSAPVKELTRGVQMVEKQRFDYRIVSTRRDELGGILKSFNDMNGALQEKELMGQMLSGAARRVAKDEESLRLAEMGQRLGVSVLYLSVPGFSMFVDTMDASVLMSEVRDQIDVICRIIIENGGEVDKLMGEKVLAWFFSPIGTDESNKNAFAAMAAIRELERSGRLHFPVSVGIHCGEVIAGLLGVGNKRDFTIIGDPVNTAARICARGSELPCERFLISEEVKSSLALNESSFREFGEVQLKGREASVSLCQVLFGR